MEVKNSLVKKEERKTFSAYLAQDAIKNKINQMIGGAKGQQFITSILSAVSANPKLAECDNGSIISAALVGQALNLSPSPQLGQVYIVPFNDRKKGCFVAQFQIGYKGYIQLAIRSGYYKKINVIAIKEGELIKYNPLTEELEVTLIEDDEVRENTPTIGYYAMFEYMNGFTKSIYWSKKKMLAHADKYSMAFNAQSYKMLLDGQIPQKDLWKYSSFWYKDFDGMAYKTMLRQLISKWGIMSVEMENAFEKDMAEIKENGDYEYIDNNIENDTEFNQENETEEKQIEQEETQFENKSTTENTDFFFGKN